MPHVRAWLIAGAVGAALAAAAAPLILCQNAIYIPAQARLEPSSALADELAHGDGAQWEAVSIRAADDATLRAWCFTPQHPSGAAVILLHGVADTRRGVLGHARFLLRHDFTVLTPDARGHGVSGGEPISYGLREADDLHRWAGWFCGRPGAGSLYGLGESMGAAILLQSLRVEPRFRAVVAESPFVTFEEVAYDRMRQFAGLNRVVAWPLVRPGLFYARALYGLDLHQASPATALRATKVPVLLIHGTADRNIPPRHSRALHALNPATELWEVPGAGHTAALSTQPDLYERKVVEWFRTHP
jgi:uncharacterized protein